MSVDFVLNAFEQTITLDAAAQIPKQALSLSGDVTLTLSNTISAVDLQKVFFFHTDQAITSNEGGLTDSSYVSYYTDVTQWPATPSISNTLNAANGTVSGTGSHVSGDHISKDFIRELAKQLFGTYLGADLFTNEDTVVADINQKTASIGLALENKIKNVDISGGRLNPTLCSMDASNNWYVKDSTSPDNIVREMFLQMMEHAATRFANIHAPAMLYDGATDNGFYKMPFVAGDSFRFRLTVNAASDQTGPNGIIQTGPTSITPRVYLIVLNVVA